MTAKKKTKPNRFAEGQPNYSPLTPEEQRHAKNICNASGFADSIVDARWWLDGKPDQVTDRQAIDALAELASALNGAAKKLRKLPLMVQHHLLATNRGRLPSALDSHERHITVNELAQTLDLVGVVAKAAGNRLKPSSGHPFDFRLVNAIDHARGICRKYTLQFSATKGPALDIVNLILRSPLDHEVDEHQFRRASAHMRLPTKKK